VRREKREERREKREEREEREERREERRERREEKTPTQEYCHVLVWGWIQQAQLFVDSQDSVYRFPAIVKSQRIVTHHDSTGTTEQTHSLNLSQTYPAECCQFSPLGGEL
jgi:hypothetical protein